MPDLVVLEAKGPTAFHYTFTGATLPLQPRLYFPGNRITDTRSHATLVVTNDPTKWREVVDYNVAPYPPPAWPASGSIPSVVEAPPPPELPSPEERR